MTIKIITILFLLILTGCSNQLGFALTRNEFIDEEIIKIEKLQESDKQEDEKYKRRDKYTFDNIEYETHEYKTPKGEVGYIIYLTKNENGEIYKKVIVTGVEQSREYDWYLINPVVEKTATSTTK